MPASAVGEDSGVTFAATNPTLLLPALYLVFKRDNWGIYGAFTVPGGGGELEYDDGVYSTYKTTKLFESVGVSNPEALGSSVYYGVTLGGAWRPIHWLSLALGARMLIAKGSAISYMQGGNGTLSVLQNEKGEPAADGDVIVENQRSALGVSGHLGVDFIPMEELVIGLRYEHQTALDWTNEKMFDGTASKSGEKRYGKEGETYRRDLPGVVGLGVSYQFLPTLRAEASYTMYLNPLARWKSLDEDGHNLADDHDLGWETGIGIEYKFLNLASWMPTLGLSTGVLYANTGANSKSYDPLKPALDHITWGGGIFAELT
jgi:long-chain fatty acid transport protein